MDPENKRVWITGANGLLGNYLVRAAPPNLEICALTRERLDLLDFSAVRREFQKAPPALIIHCAAISTVAGALADRDLARRTNVECTALLAELAADARLIFFSTDFVFDGRKGNYAETDAVNPISFYGETKAAAEEIVLRNPRHLVVRTSINCGTSASGNRGFNEQLRAALQKGRMALFTDEFRCPIFAGETARATWELAQKDCAGIFHAAGAEKLSRWRMGQLLVQRWPELADRIEPGCARDFPGPPRALDTSLNVSKAQKILDTPLPRFSDWLGANPGENV
ncbi:MAG: NAD(P)-dependent oxidoreductase [Verrucomicrobiota bacterium]|nr:NAD(P)-dependent oxidoreductase [Verrucomicrobiota bacterium]